MVERRASSPVRARVLLMEIDRGMCLSRDHCYQSAPPNIEEQGERTSHGKCIRWRNWDADCQTICHTTRSMKVSPTPPAPALLMFRRELDQTLCPDESSCAMPTTQWQWPRPQTPTNRTQLDVSFLQACYFPFPANSPINVVNSGIPFNLSSSGSFCASSAAYPFLNASRSALIASVCLPVMA